MPVHCVPAARPVAFTATVNTELAGLALKLPAGERLSQLLLVQLCSDACAAAPVVVCDVTVSVCDAGFPPPTTALNVNDDGLSERPVDVGLVTFKVTLAVCVPEGTVIEMVPLHEVPAVNPVGFTEIVKLVFVELAVKLPVGESVNQLLLVQLCSETAAVALTLLCAVTPSVCEAGAVPPAIALNVKAWLVQAQRRRGRGCYGQRYIENQRLLA